jgi:hypothetical protein
VYDTTPPTDCVMEIEEPYPGFTNDPTPTIYAYAERADHMRFALGEPELSGATYVPYSIVYSAFDISGTTDGPRTIFGEFKDRLGNTQGSHPTVDTYYDTTPPESSITALPQYASGGSIGISWQAVDGDGSGVAETTFYHKRGADTYWRSASLSGTSNTFSFTELTGDGDYYFTLVSEDNVGNWENGPPVDVGEEGVYHVLYETAKPVSKATAVSVNDATGVFTVHYDYNDDAGDYVSGVTCVSLWVLASGTTEYVLVETHSGVTLAQPFQYTPDPLVEGSYRFYTIATDRAGNMEDVPSQGYDIEAIYSNEFAGYAILAVGSISGEEGLDAHTLTANNVYTHLINRNFGLSDEPNLDHIRYYNPYFEPQPGEDDYSEGGTVSYWDALRKAVTEWALNKMKVRAGPLYIILIDHGISDKFYLTGTQHVTSEKLDEWITVLEDAMAIEGIPAQNIVIILGTCYSGSFIGELSGTSRVIVTSTAYNEPSYRGPMEPGGVRDGEFFISSLFNELGQGYDLKTSFGRSVQRTEVHTNSGVTNSPAPYFDTAMQHPLLDDDGSGSGTNNFSSGNDGDIAKDIYLGWGIGAPEPVVITQTGKEPETPLAPAETQAILWATVSGTTSEQVWVEIREPGLVLEGGEEQQVVDLTEEDLAWSAGDNRYHVTYSGFDAAGTYTLFFYVKDTSGIISPFVKAYVYKSLDGNQSPDAFDLLSPESGTTINASSGVGFAWEVSEDPDGDPVTYTLEVWNDPADTRWGSGVTFYYKMEGITKPLCFAGDEADFTDLRSYLWKVTAVDYYGAGTPSSQVWGFDIDNTNTLNVWVEGLVYDSSTSNRQPIINAQVNVPGKSVTYPGGGYYMVICKPATYTFTISAIGYGQKEFPKDFRAFEGEMVTRDFGLEPALQGDISGDDIVNQTDLSLALQVLAGKSPSGIRGDYITSGVDVNGDNRIGMEEVIYIKEKLGGVRE